MRENKDEQEHHELMAEQSVRVISIMDRRPTGKEIHGITHPGLFLIRSKLLDPALDEKKVGLGQTILAWAHYPQSGRRTYLRRHKNRLSR